MSVKNNHTRKRIMAQREYLVFLFIVFAFATLSNIENTYAGARFTGAYLLKICDTKEDGKELVEGGHTACQAYISGVVDYHNMLQTLKIAPATAICVPETVPLNVLHQNVLKYLRINKHHDSFVAAPAVTMALYQIYPCKKRKR